MKFVFYAIIFLVSCSSAARVKSEMVGTERVFVITSPEPFNLNGVSVYVSGTAERVWGMVVQPKKSWSESISEEDFLDVANWKTEYRIVYGTLYDEQSRHDPVPKSLVKGQKYFIGVSLLPSKYSTTYTFEH